MAKPLLEYVYVLKEPLKDEIDILVHFIKRKFFQKEKGCVAYFVGMPGSGKSNGALALAEAVDPDFNVERVFFRPADWVKGINDIKPGQANIYDDAGLTANSKTWYSFSNRAVSYVSQSSRSREALTIFTVPFIDFIDSQTRRLFNLDFEPIHIDRIKKITYVKGSYIQNVAISPSLGSQKVAKTFYHSIRIVKQYDGNAVEKVNLFRFPIAKNWDAYNKKKAEFLGVFYDDLGKEFGASAVRKKEIIELENKGEKIKDVLRADVYRSSLIMAKEFLVPASFIEEQRKAIKQEQRIEKKRKDILNIHIG